MLTGRIMISCATRINQYTYSGMSEIDIELTKYGFGVISEQPLPWPELNHDRLAFW